VLPGPCGLAEEAPAEGLHALGTDTLQALAIGRDALRALQASEKKGDEPAGGPCAKVPHQSIVDPTPVFAAVDQSGGAEDGQVFGHRGRCPIDQRDELADAKLAALEGEEKAQPGFVRQGLQNLQSIAHGHFVISLDGEI
jgi:hypothetical protein